jgi:transaldolase
MKFFADTANLDEVAYCFSRGVNEGITTNPKILETTGDLSQGITAAYKSLISRFPTTPISLETDLRGIEVSEIHSYPVQVMDILLKQALELSSIGPNVVIKIPICAGGLLATKELAKKGIKTNVTACITPYQALEAAKEGATYVSLFANRMLDAHILSLCSVDLESIIGNELWKQTLKQNKANFFETAWQQTLEEISYVASQLDSSDTGLIVGSIREPSDILRIAKARPQIITIPYKIVQGLNDIPALKQTPRTIETSINSLKNFGNSLYHPMTQYTIMEFEKSADAYRKKEK